MVRDSTDPRQIAIDAQVQRESSRRTRLGVPAIAGGVIYLLSTIIVSSILSGAPTVGVFQGIAPALEGKVNPINSPRAPEVRYLSHHSTDLILGGLLAALALGALTLILVLLVQAVNFRRPERSSVLLPLVASAGALVALDNLADWVVKAVTTHNFTAGHDFTNKAVEAALFKAPAAEVVGYLGLLGGLSLCVAMFMAMFGAMRVGLIPRWLAYVGMFSALLFIFATGAAELSVIPAFWMCAMGILFIGRWPGGEPPAWPAGEARPWPSAAEMRAEREAAREGGSAKSRNGRSPTGRASRDGPPRGDAVPAPVPRPKATSRRRRKRGAGSRPSGA